MRFLLTRGTGLASRAIQTRLQERWSHGVALDFLKPDMALDSTLTHGGVKARPLHDVLRNVSAVVELWVPLPNPEKARKFAWQCVEDKIPYDVEALWGFTVGSRHWHDLSSLYCFEYLAAIWRAGGIEDFDDYRMVTGENLINLAYRKGTVNECRLVAWPVSNRSSFMEDC